MLKPILVCGVFLVARCLADKDYVEQQASLRSELLTNYNKDIKPAHKVKVNVSMFIRTIQELDIEDGHLDLQITFRQKWFDNRLVYSNKRKYSNVDYLTITTKEGDKLIWVPDTFFRNELESNMHVNLVPNEYLRVYPDGTVLYSSRISLKTTLMYNLRNYPWDEQTAIMQIASYGFQKHDIEYVWKETDPVQINKELHMKAYYLKVNDEDKAIKSTTCDVKTSTGEYSCIQLSLDFRREGSYIVLTVMVPIGMFVIISYFSHFLSSKQLGPRLALSFGSLVAASAFALYANTSVPPVAYTKSIDIFTGLSVFFIFVNLLAIVFLNFFAKEEDLEDKKGLVKTLKTGSHAARFNGALRLFCPVVYVLFCIIFFSASP